MLLRTVATATGPTGNPCCRNGKAMLRGGTNAMDANRAVRTDGFLDRKPNTAIMNNAPLAGAATAQVI
jgi:hypothetical protein